MAGFSSVRYTKLYETNIHNSDNTHKSTLKQIILKHNIKEASCAIKV